MKMEPIEPLSVDPLSGLEQPSREYLSFGVKLPLLLCVSLQVFSLVLLEKKIVIQSRDYSALTASILSLTKLLYPLEYMFPVIPLLPVSMSGSEQV